MILSLFEHKKSKQHRLIVNMHSCICICCVSVQSNCTHLTSFVSHPNSNSAPSYHVAISSFSEACFCFYASEMIQSHRNCRTLSKQLNGVASFQFMTFVLCRTLKHHHLFTDFKFLPVNYFS